MDFRLTDDQELVRRSAAEFAQKELLPHVRAWDRDSIFPVDAFRHAGELGFLGVLVPEDYGGPAWATSSTPTL